MSFINLPQITISQLPDVIKSMTADNSALLVIGAPGVGKTEVSLQTLAEIGRIPHVFIAASMEPTDIRGVPYTDGESADFVSHKFFSSIGEESAVLFDEFNRNPITMQNTFLDVIQERRAGSLNLPKDLLFICLANPSTATNMVSPLSAPLVNRCIVLRVVADVDGWLKWAEHEDNNIDPYVCAFIKKFGLPMLSPLDAETTGESEDEEPDWDAIPIEASPRAWKSVSRTKGYGLPDIVQNAMFCGTVGTSIAAEFIQFLAVGEELPDVADLFNGRVAVPNRADLQYIASRLLVAHFKDLASKGAEKKQKNACVRLAKTLSNDNLGWVPETVAFMVNMLSLPNNQPLRNLFHQLAHFEQNKDILAWMETDGVELSLEVANEK